MKLNYDCIREVLLALERLSTMQDNLMFEPLILDDFTTAISKYSDKDILYSLQKLNEVGYILATDNNDIDKPFDKKKFIIYDISYSGHEYLANIRDNKIWKQIKEKAPAFTFEIIKKIASALF